MGWSLLGSEKEGCTMREHRESWGLKGIFDFYQRTAEGTRSL